MAAAAAPLNPLDLTDAQLEAGFTALEARFRFLLEDRRVPKNLMSSLGHFDVTEEELFGRVAPAGDEVAAKAFFVRSLRLTEADHPIQLLRLVDAWARARASVDMAAKRRAEEGAAGEQLVMPPTTYLSVLQALYTQMGVQELPDAQVPSKGYLESRLEQLEEGLLLPERLEEATSLAEERAAFSSSGGALSVRAGGTLVVQRARRVQGSQPRSTEALRKRHLLMAACYTLVKLRQPSCPILLDFDPEVFKGLTDFVLGPHVYLMGSEEGAVTKCPVPSWELLLSFEYELRAAAFKKMRLDRVSMKAAFAAVIDQNLDAGRFVRHSHFFEPLLLSAAGRSRGRRASEFPADDERPPPKAPKKDRDPKGAGKGKSKNSTGQERAAAQEPLGRSASMALQLYKHAEAKGMLTKGADAAGQLPCYPYNNTGCPDRKGCRYAHICMACGGKHPACQCEKVPTSFKAAGSR